MSSLLTTRVVGSDPAQLEMDAAEVQVIAGPDRGMSRELDVGSVLIGSGSRCDMVLHDSSVSAKHAEILCTATSGYILRDLNSTNGVLLGRHRVERVVLGDRMRLVLGETTLAIRSRGGRVSFPLESPGQLGRLVAHSVKMRAFVATLKQLAPMDATVLLEGESGTGKELVAETLHAASLRRNGPFVPFDCAAVNRSLAAAALFGHEKGAFTGAVESRPGIYEQADGGTLFLDEIGELPLDVQPLLLAALERRTIRRLGGKQPIVHDVRIVAATNRNLGEEVRAKRFRADLFYRLAVARLRVPPLRDRPEDLAILAAEFARDAEVVLSPEILIPLKAYDWPGNVRELRNTIQRLAFAPDEVQHLARPRLRAFHSVDGAHDGWLDLIFDEQGQLRSLPDARRSIVDGFERRYLECALEDSRGNLSRAAELAGVSRQSLTELVVKHGLHPRKS